MRQTLGWLLPLTLLLALPSFAAERGIKRVEIRTQAGETVGLYEESHALVIDVSDYTAGWPRLRGVSVVLDQRPGALPSHSQLATFPSAVALGRSGLAFEEAIVFTLHLIQLGVAPIGIVVKHDQASNLGVNCELTHL